MKNYLVEFKMDNIFLTKTSDFYFFYWIYCMILLKFFITNY